MKSIIKKVTTNGEIFYVNKFLSDEIKNLLDNLPMNVIPKLESFLKTQPELYVILKTQSGDKEVSGFLSFFTFR